jgi:hypothetical protein
MSRKEKIPILGSKAVIFQNKYDVWQFRMYVKQSRRYVEKSLRTKEQALAEERAEGIFLWFAVGVMWKDKAIMVVHVGAFISLFLGYLYS